uniref:Uncharacterized protein n=1 Tax=Cyprinodon variegatus TaxID=28743 RepID=A0A3Q2CQ12_CYPVA
FSPPTFFSLPLLFHFFFCNSLWKPKELEELCSDSVERIVVNPNAAYDKFKDKHVSTKGLVHLFSI